MLGQRTSPFLQEKFVELGLDDVFGNVPDRVSSLLGIEVNASQVYRSCQNVGAVLSENEISSPCEGLAKAQSDPAQVVYGMVDGSMLFTDGGWQETKVGRVFTAELIERSAEKADNEDFKWKMEQSHYIAKRGHYSGFTEIFERLMPPTSKCKKVFVTDGAAWIGQWIKESYPNAVHILDLFHVCEKLATVAPKNVPNWLERQKERLLDNQCEEVVKAVKNLSGAGVEAVGQVVNYLENNCEKMQYGLYRQQGWMIGSGPIESAHRTLLQVRMKRSGQRWHNEGCDNMIKLRVVFKNNRKELVKRILKMAA